MFIVISALSGTKPNELSYTFGGACLIARLRSGEWITTILTVSLLRVLTCHHIISMYDLTIACFTQHTHSVKLRFLIMIV